MILFNLLVRLFPRSFRAAFGDDIRTLFAEQRGAAHDRGGLPTATLWLRTVAGMTAAAWRERSENRTLVLGRTGIIELLPPTCA
jgi:hypothetical protein